MIRRSCLWFAVAITLAATVGFAPATLAQTTPAPAPAPTPAPAPAAGGAATGGGEMSWFKMFFWADDFFGLIQIWVIILMSAVSVALMIKFYLDTRRSVIIPEETAGTIETMLQEKRYREAIDFAASDPSFLGKVVNAGLSEASNGYSAMERAVEEVADGEATKMLRPLESLNVMGNIAPMLGLFGTVYGMIVAFAQLVADGGRPDPAKLAGGISTALVTTFWGLVVAMPALAAYAVIRNKVDALCVEGLIRAEDLIKPFKPAARKAATAPAPAQPSTVGSMPGAMPGTMAAGMPGSMSGVMSGAVPPAALAGRAPVRPGPVAPVAPATPVAPKPANPA
jgi:biopolymer transport protein ExbB